jgi:hypothetical protein
MVIFAEHTKKRPFRALLSFEGIPPLAFDTAISRVPHSLLTN